MSAQIFEAEKVVKLRSYWEDEHGIQENRTYIFPAMDVLLETDWKTTYHRRWEDVPAGVETQKEKVIIARHINGKIYIILLKKYRYELDNGLQWEFRENFEIYEPAEVQEELEKILRAEN